MTLALDPRLLAAVDAPSSAPHAHALLIDPDPASGASPALDLLRRHGFRITRAPSPASALGAALATFDLVLLETGAADDEAALACRALQHPRRPLIAWSGRDGDLERVAALSLGVDDFVSKASHPLELLARVRAALRRARRHAPASPADAPGWLFDPLRRELRAGPAGLAVELSPQAAKILEAFCRRPRRLLAREEVAHLASRDGVPIGSRSADAAVSRLRRTLAACGRGGHLLRTVTNGGYVLEADVEPVAGALRLRAAQIAPANDAA